MWMNSIFLFQISFFILQIYGINIDSISYQTLNAQFLGDKYQFFLYKIDFDEDLYIVESIECEPYCSLEDQESPCNYTLSREECLLAVNETDYCLESECFDGPPLMKEGVKYPFRVDDINISTFYYFYNPKKCHAAKFYIDYEFGNIDIIYLYTKDFGFWDHGEFNVHKELRYFNVYSHSICPPESFGDIAVEFEPNENKLSIAKGVIWFNTYELEILTEENKEKYVELEDDYSSYFNIKPNILYELYVDDRMFLYFNLEIRSGCHYYLFKIDKDDRNCTMRDSISNQQVAHFNYKMTEKHFFICSNGSYYNSSDNNPERTFVKARCQVEDESYAFINWINSLDNPKSFIRRKISDYSANQMSNVLTTSASLNCSFGYYFCNVRYGQNCDRFFSIGSFIIPPVFWPLPEISKNSPIINGLETNSELWSPSIFTNSVRANQTLMFSMVLSAYVDEMPYNYNTEQDAQNCNITLINPPINSKGEPYLGSRNISFKGKPKKNQCDYQKFVDFSNSVDVLFKNMTQNKGQLQFNSRAEVDMAMVSFDYTDCINFIDETLQDMSIIEQDYYSDKCLFENKNNPCCNARMKWAHNCVPTNQKYFKTVINSTKESEIEIYCNSPQCVDELALPEYQELRSYQLDTYEGCSQVLPNYNKFIYDSFKVYGDCLNEFLTFRRKCTSDSDCKPNRCDFTTLQCLDPYQEREISFLNCFWKNSDQRTKEYIMNEKGLITNSTTTDEEIIEMLYNVFLEDKCVGKYDQFYFYEVTFDRSVYSNNKRNYDGYKVIDPLDKIPSDLNYKYNLNNDWSFEYRSHRFCNSYGFICNWNQSISEYCDTDNQPCKDECEQNYRQYFCGNCENDRDCFDVSLDLNITEKEECENSGMYLCYFGEEEPILIDENESCGGENNFFCDNKCLNSSNGGSFYDCTSKEECSTFGGRCVLDPQRPLEDITNWDRYLTHQDISDTTKEYICQISPRFNYTDPNYSCSGRLTILGCFSSYTSESSCSRYGGKWYIPPIASSPEECSSIYGQACFEEYVDKESMSKFATPLQMNMKSKEQCKEAGGIWKDIMSWVPGNWVQYQSRNLTWNKSKYYDTIPNTNGFDLYSFRNTLQNALDDKYTNYLVNEASCLYSRIFTPSQITLCDCPPNNNNNNTFQLNNDEESKCFLKETTQSLGFTALCPGLENIAFLPPTTLEFEKNSLKEEMSCLNVEVFSESSSIFEEPFSEEILAVSILSLRQNYDTYSYGFRNKHSSFVGQIVGSGIKSITHPLYSSSPSSSSSSYSSSSTYFQNMTLCVKVVNLNEYLNKKFNIPDFGVLTNFEKNQMEPQNVKIEVFIWETNQPLWNNKQIWENKDKELKFCGKFEKFEWNTTYFPVMRINDWKDEDVNGLSDSDIAFSFLLGFLYFTLGLISLGIFGVHLTYDEEKRPSLGIRSLLLIISMFGVLRSIYFFLLADKVIDQSDTVAQYILIDCVTILFFTTFLSYLVLVWIPMIYFLFQIKGLNFEKFPTVKILIFVNGLIYLFAIGMVIAYEESKNTSKVYFCGVQVGTEKDTSDQDIVTQVYQIFWALYSMLVSLGFMFVAIKLFGALTKVKNSSVKSENYLKSVLLSVILIISFSFFVQSIAYLTLQFVGQIEDMSVIFVYLLVVELIPCVVVITLLRPTKKIDSASTKKSNDSSSRFQLNSNSSMV